MGERPTFVVIWNPDRWPAPADREWFEKQWAEDVKSTQGRRPTPVVSTWSFGNAKAGYDVQPGDAVFFLRVGRDRGVLGSGAIHDAIRMEQHWDDPKKSQSYVQIRWDRLMPLDHELPTEAINNALGTKGPLRVRASGRRLQPTVANTIARLWDRHTEADGGADVRLLAYSPKESRLSQARRKWKGGRQQPELYLQDAYARRLRKAGNDVTRPQYRVNGRWRGREGDLYDATNRTLIEVKVPSDSRTVRNAIEQIEGYAEFHGKRPKLALLFDSRPSDEDIRTIRKDHKIACVWRKGRTFESLPPIR